MRVCMCVCVCVCVSSVKVIHTVGHFPAESVHAQYSQYHVK